MILQCLITVRNQFVEDINVVFSCPPDTLVYFTDVMSVFPLFPEPFKDLLDITCPTSNFWFDFWVRNMLPIFCFLSASLSYFSNSSLYFIFLYLCILCFYGICCLFCLNYFLFILFIYDNRNIHIFVFHQNTKECWNQHKVYGKNWFYLKNCLKPKKYPSYIEW